MSKRTPSIRRRRREEAAASSCKVSWRRQDCEPGARAAAAHPASHVMDGTARSVPESGPSTAQRLINELAHFQATGLTGPPAETPLSIMMYFGEDK